MDSGSSLSKQEPRCGSIALLIKQLTEQQKATKHGIRDEEARW